MTTNADIEKLKASAFIKKGIKDASKKDYWQPVGQRWWNEELKGLNAIERCILVQWKLSISKKFTPSERFIARKLNISRNTTSKYIKKLRKLGHL